METAMAPELIRGLDAYADVLGCCIPTVRRLIADGTLPGKRIGNSYMTTRSALLAAIAAAPISPLERQIEMIKRAPPTTLDRIAERVRRERADAA